MLTERAPPIQVNMPASSDTMVGEDGKYYKVRIGKDGKMEAIPLAVGDTALKPPAPAKEDGQTPENAGKISMSQQAVEGVQTMRKLLFDDKGNINKALLFAMTVPGTTGMPGNTNARIARSAMRNAVEAKLRIETGAAATESEVVRTLDRFIPTVMDTQQSAAFKLDELENFFKGALSQTKGVKPTAPKRIKFNAQGEPIQ